jgi:hypothetical protein
MAKAHEHLILLGANGGGWSVGGDEKNVFNVCDESLFK